MRAASCGRDRREALPPAPLPTLFVTSRLDATEEIFAALVSEETPRRVMSEWITLLVLGGTRCLFSRHPELILGESDHKRFPGRDVGGTPDDLPID